MKLTVIVTVTILLTACGGSSNQAASPTQTSAGTTTTTSAAPSLDERAQLFAYDQSAPLNVVEKSTRGDVVDLTFDAADRAVSAYLVRPRGKPKAAILWAHWYGEEANPNRKEFLPDALALAKAGVLSLLPQQFFPWQEKVVEDATTDRKLAIDQVIQLRRGLDLLQEQAGDVPLAFVGHDYGAMFGSLLVADNRPQAYVLMAPDATFSNWFLKYFVSSASKSELDEAFAPLDPVNNVGDVAPASLFLQLAKSDKFVPSYVADKLAEAASDPKKVESYEAAHELNDDARKDRIAGLRETLRLG